MNTIVTMTVFFNRPPLEEPGDQSEHSQSVRATDRLRKSAGRGLQPVRPHAGGCGKTSGMRLRCCWKAV